MKTALVILMFATLIPQTCSAAEPRSLDFTPDPERAGMAPEEIARIKARLQSFVDDGNAAGIVALLARHGQVAMLTAVGYQDRERREPMRTDTIFQCWSNTKPVTAMGIMTLVEQGRLALIDPVEKYLPRFKGQMLLDAKGARKPSRPITIWDLLTHTSGLPRAFPPSLKDLYHNFDRPLAEVVDAVSSQILESEPGTVWRYSGPGMATLGRIVEVVSGTSYSQYIGEHIFQPLRMKDSFFFLPAEKRSRIAAVYKQENGTLTRADANLYREGAVYPAPDAGMYSTATDLVRLYQALLNGGILDGQRVLSPASVRVMTQVDTGDLDVAIAPGLGYGLGFYVVRNALGTFRLASIGTFGHSGAWKTYEFCDPQQDLIEVLLMQRTTGRTDTDPEINAFSAMAAAAIDR